MLDSLIYSSSAFSKSSLNIWKFMVHVLLKPGFKKFENYFASVWDECNCVVVWTFLALPIFCIGMKTDLFQSCDHCWLFQICWHIECSTFTASSFRIWNSSTGIRSLPLVLFIVMLPKVHLTSHFRISGSRWVITPSWLSGSWRSFLYSSSVYSCHLFLISSASLRSIQLLSFIVSIFAWKFHLVSLIFLKRNLVFPTLLFSSISLHWSLRKAFLSPCYSLELCILMDISFLFSFAFHFSSFHSCLQGFLRQAFCLCAFLFLGKTIALTRRTLVGKVMSLLCNMLSSLIIAFLPRRTCHLISLLQSLTICSNFEGQENKVSHSSIFSLSICHELMEWIP